MNGREGEGDREGDSDSDSDSGCGRAAVDDESLTTSSVFLDLASLFRNVSGSSEQTGYR